MALWATPSSIPASVFAPGTRGGGIGGVATIMREAGSGGGASGWAAPRRLGSYRPHGVMSYCVAGSRSLPPASRRTRRGYRPRHATGTAATCTDVASRDGSLCCHHTRARFDKRLPSVMASSVLLPKSQVTWASNPRTANRSATCCPTNTYGTRRNPANLVCCTLPRPAASSPDVDQ